MSLSSIRRPFVVVSGIFSIALFACVLISIRSSFLAVSFGARGVDGKVYCAIESSLGVGFLASFFLRLVERLTYSYKVPLKVILLSAYGSAAVLGVATGLVFWLQNNTLVVGLSFLVRALQGIAHHTYCHSLVECLKAWFPKHFTNLIGMVLNTGLPPPV